MSNRFDGNVHVEGTLSAKRVSLPAQTVESDDLGANLRIGRMMIPIISLREIVTNAVPNTAANGGLLASDTTPILERVNGATDPALRVKWAASNSDPVSFSVMSPHDLDSTTTVTVTCRAKMGGATDTPAIAVDVREDVGGSDLGGNTGALSDSLANVSRTFTPTATSTAQKAWTITLTPGTHTTDTVELYGLEITYRRTT